MCLNRSPLAVGHALIAMRIASSGRDGFGRCAPQPAGKIARWRGQTLFARIAAGSGPIPWTLARPPNKRMSRGPGAHID